MPNPSSVSPPHIKGKFETKPPNVTIAFQNQRDHFVNKDSEILPYFAFQKDQKNFPPE
jgi:hypothetical protein